MGGGRIRAGDKAAGRGKLPMASKQYGDTAVELPAVPMADGGTEDRVAEGE